MKSMHILAFIMIILNATGERWIWKLEDKAYGPVGTELYSVFIEESIDWVSFTEQLKSNWRLVITAKESCNL